MSARLEDDMNESNGFVIKTKSGKDFYINATSQKEKEDWMTTGVFLFEFDRDAVVQ